MVALKNLDPIFGANQLLAQANSFFGQTWNPDREIDFNKMVHTQNLYDAAQRQSDAQEYAADELKQGASLDDVARIKSEYARMMGDPSMFEKAQEEQQQRDQEKKLAELYSQGSDVDQMRNELERIKLAAGDVEGAMKLQPKDESKYSFYRGGIKRFNPATGKVEVLAPPMAPQGGEGRAPKLGRYMDPNTGEVMTPDFNDPEQLKNLDPLAINLSKSSDPIVSLQIKKALEAKAKRDALREQESRAPQQTTPTPDPVSSVSSLKQAYEQMMGQGGGPKYEIRELNGKKVKVLLGR